MASNSEEPPKSEGSTAISAPSDVRRTAVYVLIPPSPLFAAHWSFFLPDTLPFDNITKRYEESNLGRRIHVSGDRLNGFTLEIIRDYDVRKHRSVGSRRFAIGVLQLEPSKATHAGREAQTHLTEKDDEDGGGYVDNNPIDDFERVCVVEVEAPGPSLNSATGPAGGKRVKAEVRDCQWWVKQAVQALVSKGILIPQDGQNPNEIVAGLPVH